MSGNRRDGLFGRRKSDKVLPIIFTIQIAMLLALYTIDVAYLGKLAAAHREVQLIRQDLSKMAADFRAFLKKTGLH